jgi:hypothetical protein
MNQRAGVSLLEVLITMFVLTLGLLGVMAMFPLGVVRIAQAIKDDRCATLNNDSGSVFRWIWKEEFDPLATGRSLYLSGPPIVNGIPSGNGVASLFPLPDRFDPFVNARLNVNFSPNPDIGMTVNPLSATPNLNVVQGYHGASYPVFVDPIGWNNTANAGTPQQFWVGGSSSCIPRRSLRRIEFQPRNPPGVAGYINANATATKVQLMNRYLVLPDDISFGLDGTPAAPVAGVTSGPSGANFAVMAQQVQREGRYSCAYMIQWPDSNRNTISEATMSIVVYSGRSIDGPIKETPYNAIFIPKSTEVQIYYTPAAGPPNLHKGSWILDSTMSYLAGNPPTPVPDPHGFFYRVVNVTANDSVNGIMTVEIQAPALNSNPTVYANGQPYGIAVVMEGVAEVFSNRHVGLTSAPVP